MRNITTWLAAIAAIVLMAACNQRRVYDSYLPTPLSGWEKNDTLTFITAPMDTSGVYATTLGLRTNSAYPFTAITLIVEQRAMPAGTLRTDTLNCQLTDERGTPTGKGTNYYQYEFPVGKMTLHAGDSLHINVRHDMKREILPGIANVGICIERR